MAWPILFTRLSLEREYFLLFRFSLNFRCQLLARKARAINSFSQAENCTFWGLEAANFCLQCSFYYLKQCSYNKFFRVTQLVWQAPEMPSLFKLKPRSQSPWHRRAIKALRLLLYKNAVISVRCEPTLGRAIDPTFEWMGTHKEQLNSGSLLSFWCCLSPDKSFDFSRMVEC